MEVEEHVALLKQGRWNAWRRENPNIMVNLRGANLSGANLMEAYLIGVGLSGANLSGANLSRANLIGAHLTRANLSGANLSRAILRGAYLDRADLRGAKLSGANLMEANLMWANLSGASLMGALLQGTVLIGTDLTDADLTGCHIYGISAWDLKLDKTKQQNLIITRPKEPAITVDNIEVAQFIYLMLHNQKIREVIDCTGSIPQTYKEFPNPPSALTCDADPTKYPVAWQQPPMSAIGVLCGHSGSPPDTTEADTCSARRMRRKKPCPLYP
jgi:hypothetical protein